MTKTEIIRGLVEPGVIAIIRTNNSAQLIDATRALLEGGIRAVEITMTTPNALEIIRETSRAFGEKVIVGVGSVLDETTARLAIEVGAQFVVTPVLRPTVIELCLRYAKPVMSGAYTPTEALIALETGSDFIKIFPADGLGPNYIKAIRAPLPQLQIVPTGGINVQNCGEFIRAGSVAVAAGSSLVSDKLVKAADWQTLTSRSAQFVSAVAESRKRQ